MTYREVWYDFLDFKMTYLTYLLFLQLDLDLSLQEKEQRSGSSNWHLQYRPPLPEKLLSLCGPVVCNLCHAMGLDAPSTARSHYLGRPHEKRVAVWLEVRNSAVVLLLINYVGTN